MKKLYYFLWIPLLLYSSQNYELQLYEKILPLLFHSNTMKVYADNDAKNILKGSTKFKILSKCDKSVVVIIGKKFSQLPQVCKEKPLFATSYRAFKYNKSSFGAFYWRKGRPQLRFKNNILNKFHIKLPTTLRKFAK